MSIENLYTEAAQPRDHWQGIYNRLTAGGYDLTAPRPALNGNSVEHLHKQLLTIFDLFYSIRPTDPSSADALLLLLRVPDLLIPVRQLNERVNSIRNQIDTYWREGGQILDSNGNLSLRFLSGGNEVGSWDASGTFTEVANVLRHLFSLVAEQLTVSPATAIGDLSERAKSLSDTVRNVENIEKHLSGLQKSAEAVVVAIRGFSDAAQKEGEAVKAVAATSQASQSQAQASLGAVTELIEKIKVTGGDADRLAELVRSYQSQFEAFQAQLNNRGAQFEKFERDNTSAAEANAKREGEIDRLSKLADTMISGATTAGLAKSLEDTRNRYSKKMDEAKDRFYIAIVFLLISALPLAAHLLPGLFASWLPTTAEQDTAYSVLARILVLAPATWLSLFFSSSYTHYFHLEREYAHKAALAMAVDGFQRQAPEYKEQITAEVFLEVLTNPASRKAPKPVEHPLMEALKETVRRLFKRIEADK